MKNGCFFVFLLLSMTGYSQITKTYYEVLDASEANKLYNAIKGDSTNIPGWPMPTTAVEGKFLPSQDYLRIIETDRQEIDAHTILIKAKVSTLNFWGEGLRGIVPAVKLDSLETLGLSSRGITGLSPELTLNKLTELGLAYCNIKSFPKNKFPSLRLLNLTNTGMTGSIPTDLNVLAPNLEVLFLDENELTGNLEFNLPKLKSLLLDQNKLTGTLNKLSLPSLTYLDVADNNFEGLLEISSMPSLISLEISDNRFNAFGTNFIANTPSLKYFYVSSNAFEFDDLMPLIARGYADFGYGGQAPKDLKLESVLNKQKLTAEVAGAGNTYNWYYVHPSSRLRKLREDSISLYLSLFISFEVNDTSIYKLINGENNNFLEISHQDNPIFYGCKVSDATLPKLKIAAVYPAVIKSNCWENDYFSFCLKEPGAKWEAGKKNEIKSTGLVSINDFLSFKGALTMDTTNLKIKIDGKIYVQDIPLPGGSVGNFTLAEGIYELELAGKDGVIAGFINDGLKRFVPEIGGLKIKLDSLALVGGKSAKGVSISFSIKINNITPCGESIKKTAEVKIKGVSITSDGIQVEELESENMGFAPGFCLKELKAKYNYKEDELSFALTLLTPFIEIGGGVELKKGALETVEFKAELQNLIIPLGTTGIGVIGCEGKVSKITTPPFNLKFGGIISAVANDHLFRLTTSAEFIPPGTLKLAAGDGKFFNPPTFGDDWWLAEGGIYGALDFKSYRLKMGGNIKMAPYKNKKDEKAFISSGSIDMAVRKDPIGMVFTGLFKGSTIIPELRDGMPYDWLNAKLGLPYSVSGDALLVYKPTAKFISGDVNLGSRIGDVHYDINLSKRYNEEGFFSFILKDAKLSTSPRSSNVVSTQIPPQTRIAIVKATGKTTLPVIELTTPTGQIINKANPGSFAELDKSASSNKVFWTLYQPPAGSWTISSVSGDSVEVYFMPYDYDLKLKAQHIGNDAEVTWNNTDFKFTDSIDFYIDDDTSGFDGIYIASTTGNQTKYILDYSKAQGFCSFYVYALSYKDGLVKAKYASSKFDNPYNGFAAPTALKTNYSSATGILTVEWTPAAQEDLAGYVIGLENKSGNQVLDFLSSTYKKYQDTIPGLIDPVIYIQSYGNNGQISCPVSSQKTVPTQSVLSEESWSPINIFPNPNNGYITIDILSQRKISPLFYIYNMLGQLVKKVFVQSVSGSHQIIEIDLKDLEKGQYFLAGIVGNTPFTKKIVVIK